MVAPSFLENLPYSDFESTFSFVSHSDKRSPGKRLRQKWKDFGSGAENMKERKQAASMPPAVQTEL
jgi:hypothetical protein